MNKTLHYKLNKPDYDDYADIGDLNINADITDTELYKRAHRVISPTVGNFAALDAKGDIYDSGKSPNDLVSMLDERLTGIEMRLVRVEDAIFSDITGNPFLISFDDLSGIKLIRGIWNRERQRIEC